MDTQQQLILAIVGVAAFVLLLMWFNAYVMYKIGKKLGRSESLGHYFIPIYNIVLLSRSVQLNAWWLAVPLVNIGFISYMWAKIAEKLGRDFWLHMIGNTIFFGIPIFIIAFSSEKEKKVVEGSLTDKFDDYSDMEHGRYNYPDNQPSPKKYTIDFLSGELVGNSIDFNEGDILIIGRDPSLSNIIINNQKISRQHLKIDASSSGGVKLIDLDSANGSYSSFIGLEYHANTPASIASFSMFDIQNTEEYTYFLADANIVEFRIRIGR